MFTSTVEFSISAMYVGEALKAQHQCCLYPGRVRITGAGSIILGETRNKSMLSIRMRYRFHLKGLGTMLFLT